MELPHHPGEDLGLDRQQDQVALGDRLPVALDGHDPKPVGEATAPVLAGVAGRDPVGRDHATAKQPGDHRLRHHPGADEG